jgi:hypothetical protein
MEGNTQTAAERLAEYEQDHPEYSFGQVRPGHHYAWKPEPGDKFAGELTHGTAAELLAKLDSG